jgi:hypothetical protein
MTLILPYRVDDEETQANFDALSLQVAQPPANAQTSITLANAWTVQAGFPAPKAVRYGNMVTFHGVFNGAAATAATVTTLPAGFRPSGTIEAPLNYWNGAGARILGTVQVASTGVVNLFGNNDALVKLTDYAVAVTFSVL